PARDVGGDSADRDGAAAAEARAGDGERLAPGHELGRHAEGVGRRGGGRPAGPAARGEREGEAGEKERATGQPHGGLLGARTRVTARTVRRLSAFRQGRASWARSTRRRHTRPEELGRTPEGAGSARYRHRPYGRARGALERQRQGDEQELAHASV